MNKIECKKYIRRAFKKIERQNKSITPQSLELAMLKEINEEKDLYIAYGKIAINNLKHSANIITADELSKQVDVIERIYTEIDILTKAKKL